MIRNSVIISVFISFAFILGFALGNNGFVAEFNKFPKVEISRQLPVTKTNVNFDLFWETWDTLNAKYYDKSKIIPYKMVYGAIKGMVSSIGDPYTIFLNPDENKIVEDDLKGNFQGVGIQIGYIKGQLAVIAPLPFSPAEKAGIKAGDLILEIKDKSKNKDVTTSDMTIPDAVSLIRGPQGTKVTLVLFRDGEKEPIEREIERAIIDVPSVILEFKNKKDSDNKSVAYIKVTKFSEETFSEWNEAVSEILKNPDTKSIIVDVRNNPGGYLQSAVDLASDFLDTGNVVVIEESDSGKKDEYKVGRIGRLKDYQVLILINKGSASASEILAGALRDNKKIILVGDTSFGKGTIQEPEQMKGGTGLHITISKWLTPSGYWVNEKGLDPDIKVEDNQDTKEDEQLDKALELINL